MGSRLPLQLPADALKQPAQASPWPQASSSCRSGERDPDIDGARLAVFKLLCQDSQSQHLCLGHCLVGGVPIGQYSRQQVHFRQPPAIGFLFEFETLVHVRSISSFAESGWLADLHSRGASPAPVAMRKRASLSRHWLAWTKLHCILLGTAGLFQLSFNQTWKSLARFDTDYPARGHSQAKLPATTRA